MFSVKFSINGDFAALNSDLESAQRQVKAWLAEKMSVHVNRLSDLQLTSGTTHKSSPELVIYQYDQLQSKSDG